MKKFLSLLILIFCVSCVQKSKENQTNTSESKITESKYINSKKLCDSLKIEKISDIDYLLKISGKKISGKKVNSHYVFKYNDKEFDFLIKNNLLYYNGNEYFLEETNSIGDLNQNWEMQICSDEEDVDYGNYSYDKENNQFTISYGPYSLYLNVKKTINGNFDLFYDGIDGTITFNESGNNMEDVDKNKKAGTIKFLSNKVIELDWKGLYHKKTGKTEKLIETFEQKGSIELMAITEVE